MFASRSSVAVEFASMTSIWWFNVLIFGSFTEPLLPSRFIGPRFALLRQARIRGSSERGTATTPRQGTDCAQGTLYYQWDSSGSAGRCRSPRKSALGWSSLRLLPTRWERCAGPDCRAHSTGQVSPDREHWNRPGT